MCLRLSIGTSAVPSTVLGAPTWPPDPPSARSIPAKPDAPRISGRLASASVDGAGVSVPRHPVAIDREAGVDQRGERRGFTDGPPVPGDDFEAADRAQRGRALEHGLERTHGPRQIDLFESGERRQLAAVAFGDHDGTAVAHDQPRLRNARGPGA